MKTNTEKARILIVDDDQLTLTLVSAILEKHGYEVMQAKNGDDALEILVLEEPHMAMLDINMPGMSGLELARRLKSDSNLPFMFLSSITDGDIVSRAVEYGATGYLVKPVDVHNLIPALEASLARAAELQRLRERETSLTSALAAGRETSMAVGILMVRHQLDRHEAFNVLRSHARSQRKSIIDIATAILEAEELLNSIGNRGNSEKPPG